MSTSVVKWSEGLSNRVSIIIGRYINQIRFAASMAVSFITYFPHSFVSILYEFIYGCMFCVFLFNFVNYLFVLCILLVMYVPFWVVSLCCSVYCLCVNVYFFAVTFKQFNDISDNIPLVHIFLNLFTVSRAEICLP